MLFTNKEKGDFAKDPAVVKFKGIYYLYYSIMLPGNKFGVGIATSTGALKHRQLWYGTGKSICSTALLIIVRRSRLAVQYQKMGWI